MKIALHAGLIGLIIVLIVNSLDYFVESNYSEGKYDNVDSEKQKIKDYQNELNFLINKKKSKNDASR